jgi:hypothetical protein
LPEKLNGISFCRSHAKTKNRNKTMKIQIDIKSAVCGLIIGVAAMFALGMDSGGAAGRYQVSSGGQDSAFIIDTITGKAWAFQPPSTAQWRNDSGFFDAK